MLLASEIAEEYPVEGRSVRTPRGWRRIKTIYKTVPIRTVILRTSTHTLKCSFHHLVKADSDRWVSAGMLTRDDTVATDRGYEFVESVEVQPEKEVLYDLTIDDPSGAYYSNGIVSHNSTTLAARQLIESQLFPGIRSLFITPQREQLKTYARRLLEMENKFRYPLGKQNMYNKVYSNGSTIDLANALTTAEHIRGKTTDILIFDECQGFDPELLPQILYTQTTSKIPAQLYTGTALSIDTLLEARWQASSMGMWHCRAGDGKHWLNMYDAETLFKVCDHPEGPLCPYTGKRLVVTDGCFIHANMGAFNQSNVGFHIPQCIIPDIAYDVVQWAKLYAHIKTGDYAKIMQECFGIAVAEGTREITESDLVRLCVLKEGKEELKKRAVSGYYRMVISGCDWGGSDYNPAIKTKTSYTVHCIIGIAPDDRIDILHFRRYSGMQYDEIVSSIIQEHKAFNGKIISTDFGVGMAYNMEIRKYIPQNHHFIMSYVGPRSAPISMPKDAHLSNQLSLNRTEAISRVFKDIKAERLKIRARSWEEMSPFLLDFLNLYRAPIEAESGQTLFKYIRSATKADDALHAFTFAYTTMLLYLGEPLIKDVSLANQMRDALRASAKGQTMKVSTPIWKGPLAISG